MWDVDPRGPEQREEEEEREQEEELILFHPSRPTCLDTLVVRGLAIPERGDGYRAVCVSRDVEHT